MYREALGHFADAYCIRSRLALREAELGHNDAAEAHYRKAYELMPESFGRVESHCFGCERAFEGQRAESIADKVFSQLATSTPASRKCISCSDICAKKRGRYREALSHFERAVQLDPEYLNAWKHIESTGEHLQIPAARRAGVIRNIVRLDPLARQGWSDMFAEASDLVATWKAVAQANQKQPPAPTTLLALPASKATLIAETPAEKAKRLSRRFSERRQDGITTRKTNSLRCRANCLAGTRSSGSAEAKHCQPERSEGSPIIFCM